MNQLSSWIAPGIAIYLFITISSWALLGEVRRSVYRRIHFFEQTTDSAPALRSLVIRPEVSEDEISTMCIRLRRAASVATLLGRVFVLIAVTAIVAGILIVRRLPFDKDLFRFAVFLACTIHISITTGAIFIARKYQRQMRRIIR